MKIISKNKFVWSILALAPIMLVASCAVGATQANQGLKTNNITLTNHNKAAATVPVVWVTEKDYPAEYKKLNDQYADKDARTITAKDAEAFIHNYTDVKNEGYISIGINSKTGAIIIYFNYNDGTTPMASNSYDFFTPEPESNGSSNNDLPIIIGSVVGAVVVIIIIGLLIFYFKRRSNKSYHTNKPPKKIKNVKTKQIKKPSYNPKPVGKPSYNPKPIPVTSNHQMKTETKAPKAPKHSFSLKPKMPTIAKPSSHGSPSYSPKPIPATSSHQMKTKIKAPKHSFSLKPKMPTIAKPSSHGAKSSKHVKAQKYSAPSSSIRATSSRNANAKRTTHSTNRSISQRSNNQHYGKTAAHSSGRNASSASSRTRGYSPPQKSKPKKGWKKSSKKY